MAKFYLSYLTLALMVANGIVTAQDGKTESPDSSVEPAGLSTLSPSLTDQATATTTTTSTTTTTTTKPTVKANKSNNKKLFYVDSNLSKNADCPAECSCGEKKITCDQKVLTSIPNLSKITIGTTISLRNNYITNLDFNLLPSGILESLDLYNNTIKTVVPATKKLDSLAKLRALNLGLNQLGNLSANWTSWKFPLLENLDLSYNPIEELGPQTFYNTKNLQVLKIDRTKLKSIHESAFWPLTQLNSLNMSGVKLSDHLGDKQFITNNKLEFLDLTNNSLIEVPFALRGTSSIKTLILNENLLTSLRQSDFINRSSLITMEIKACPKLTSLDEYAFGNLDSLKKLVIANNPKLEYISEEIFKSDKLHKLEVFDLTGNNITSMANPLEFPSVTFEQILLSNNPWDCNCDLSWLQLMNQKSPPIHCKTPEQFKDIESSQYFMSVDCGVDSSYHSVIVTGFLIFLFVVMAAIFVQRSEVCRRLLWKDQYGTIYYTKASFPPDTV